MTHDQFHIGLEFWCGGKRWRCTDVGSRVIAAICLEPREVVEVDCINAPNGTLQERRHTSNDPGWLVGPPYAVVELVLDEYSIEGCSLVSEVESSDEPTVVG